MGLSPPEDEDTSDSSTVKNPMPRNDVVKYLLESSDEAKE
jgi:hypothetical protein